MIVGRSSIVAVLAAVLAVGCGGPTAKVEEGERPAAAPLGLKTVSTAKLPELGEYLKPLDNRRIEIAPPALWKSERDPKYLARFVKSDPLGLPRILVSVERAKLEGLETATAENVEEFARLVAADLAKKADKLLEPVRPMMIGENAFARYVLEKTFPSGPPIERQMLQTLVRGRMYTIDLQVAADGIPADRDYAYAVAAGLKFPVPEIAPVVKPAETPKPAQGEKPSTPG